MRAVPDRTGRFPTYQFACVYTPVKEAGGRGHAAPSGSSVSSIAQWLCISRLKKRQRRSGSVFQTGIKTSPELRSTINGDFPFKWKEQSKTRPKPCLFHRLGLYSVRIKSSLGLRSIMNRIFPKTSLNPCLGLHLTTEKDEGWFLENAARRICSTEKGRRVQD